ncbi:Gfo/Idh/MocA family protein [Pontibacillus salicampi]|uniref:Gfo/Idh/MocA family protein n=1 Tax=Pontibacillus salicampi TaxID=1449801 RepID=A0ABV6LQM3_9BACI
MLKVGLIGVGSISQFHIEAFQANTKAELTAFCDQNEQRLTEKGKQHDVTQLYTAYEDLLKIKEIDAVSICTWNDTHAKIAIAALDAGKHVLVEKPLSISVEEAMAVKKAEERSGKVVQVGFVRRFSNNGKLLKKFIDQGELGDIYYAKTTCLRKLGNPGGWFSDKSRSGGGPLLDLGVHMIDICWYMMGKPRPVSVSGNTYNKLGNRSNIENLSFYQAADYDPALNDVEDLANAMIRFENGASLLVDVSFTLHAKENELYVKLYGDKGGAEFEPELAIIGEKHNTILNITPQIDSLQFDMHSSFHNEINDFVDCCVDGRETIAPVQDGIEIMKMLNAVYESADKGKEVQL